MQLLETNLERLRALEGSDAPDDCQLLVDFVIDDTFAIGIACELDPELLARPELRAYLADSNGRLTKFPHRVQTYIDRTTRKFNLTLEEGEYANIARRRSAVEFLRSFSKESPFDVAASVLDTSELDEAIMDSGGGYLDAEQIPAGAPTGHWWWWHPAETPVPAEAGDG